MDLLQGLNTAQRSAVEHDGGPLVVLAGPGTGKTKLIVHRVAHLILERGVPAEQIVALTFTVKACEQLRQRLAELLLSAGGGNAAAANRVNVHTYHGLGFRLVKRFADRLGLPSGNRVELIDSAQRRRVLRSLIAQDGHMRSMLGQGVDAAALSAMETIDALSDHAIDPAGALDRARRWGERLAANSDSLDAVELARAKAEQAIFTEKARLFAACQQEQRKRGWLSFGDLITWPLALLRRDALARDLVRGEWRHGVVDEFQDVNQATVALLEELFPPKGDPDLCVVGDDDQAIYAFRGADDRAFVRFAERWQRHTVIKLEENYRSDEAVIAVANAAIGNAQSRFDPEKKVRRALGEKGKPRPAADGAAALAVLTERNTDSGEPIVAMLMSERADRPDVKWGRIAVVARGHLELDRVALALEAEGIPVDRVGGRGGGAMQDQGVKDLMAWARVLVNPLDYEHARRLLLRPPVAMSGPRLLELLARFKTERSRFEAGEGADPGSNGFIQWAASQCADDPAVQNLAAKEREFREKVAGAPAADLLMEIALRADIVHADLLPAKQRAERLSSVVSLLRFAFARQRRLDEPGDLEAFLSYFDDLDDREQEGLGEGQRVDGGEEPGIDGDESGDRGVVLITAHAAKGLEFDTVYVPKVSPGLGYPSARTSEPRLPPAVMAPEAPVGAADEDRRLAEERRLFYVACTRAERRLVILGNIPKSKSASTNFLAELVNAQPKLAAFEQTDHQSVIQRARPAGGEETAVATVAGELAEARSRKDRDAKRDELAARARAQAAAALERAFRAAVTATDLAEVDVALADAARTLAIVAEAHAADRPPSWAAKDKALSARAAAVIKTVRSGEEAIETDDGHAVQPVRGPLHLSYTQISDFERCPGCWYVKHRLKLEPTPSTEINTGVVVHEALCEFYGRWADADAQGRPLPTTDELLVIGRAKFIAASQGVIDKQELERCQQMLRTAHERLHGHDGKPVQILEHPELEIRVDLGTPGGPPGLAHTLYACIDRLERHPDIAGGVRIVDYETGRDWKKLLEPPADDLQMGIYAMAMDQFFAGGGGEHPAPRVPGVAEYWLLATGQVGSISLEKLNRTKVRDRIDKAIAGMLSGVYSTGPKCTEGLCRLLRPGVVVDP